MPSAPEPRYMGGQAVMEGVMMRGPDTWSVAVRLPDGSMEVVVHEVPRWAERFRKVPLLRGVMSLGESLNLGFKALAWSADRQLPEEERISQKAMGWTMGIAMVFFLGIFLVAPALATSALDDVIGVHGFWYHVFEGGVRLTVFLGYLVLIGRLRDIKRVFQYHGAEHKAIAAYENRVELTPESAQRFTTEHVRCGTNFLLIVMVSAIVVYAFVGRPAIGLLVASRVVLIPVIAGLAYEIIRYAARHMDKRWVRVFMKPGLLLQRLTTRQPSLDQLEISIAALRAAMTAEQIAEVDARVPRPIAALPRAALGMA